MSAYRWIVRIAGDHLRAEYAREVTTDGPSPDLAIKKALDRITGNGDDDLWQRDKLSLTAERVR